MSIDLLLCCVIIAATMSDQHHTLRNTQASLVLVSLFVYSAALSGQAANTLTAQEKAQGWQLLFDGKTLDGWHPSAPPAPSQRGATAPPPPAQPGALAQIGSTPQPCITAA